MKQSFCLTLVIFFISLIAIQAQEYRAPRHCILEPAMHYDRLKANKKALDNNLNPRSKMTLYVPVKFHLVADFEGKGRIDPVDVIQELCHLNEEYAETDLVFYIDNGFNQLDHDAVYDNPTSGGAVAKMILESRDQGSGALNVFITQNANRGSGNNGTTLGYYSPSNDYVVVRKSQIGKETSTLSHEMGHYFSLSHTHYGWDEDPWMENIHGLKVTRANHNVAGNIVPVELVDQSNCEEAADLICDTPPDYNFGLTWNSNCTKFNIEVRDRNNDLVEPSQENAMSYFLGCETKTYTPQQAAIMREDFNGEFRDHIRRDYVPSSGMLADVEIETPSFNETVEHFDKVELTWTFVENAQEYLIVLTSGSEQQIYTTDETSLILDNLQPNKNYNWSIVPINETGGCSNPQSSLFRTNDVSSPVVDPDFATQINLYPNPVSGDDKIKMTFTSNIRTISQVEISDVNGKLVYSQAEQVIQGSNAIEVELPNLTSGIYIIHVKTPLGIISRSLLYD